jgi:hypothetical protein
MAAFWPFFGRENCILKIMVFRDVTTILNERKTPENGTQVSPRLS